jgi:hypothetical protein
MPDSLKSQILSPDAFVGQILMLSLVGRDHNRTLMQLLDAIILGVPL